MEGESCTHCMTHLYRKKDKRAEQKKKKTKQKKMIDHKKKKCGTNKIRCSVTAKRNLMQVTYVQLRLIG